MRLPAKKGDDDNRHMDLGTGAPVESAATFFIPSLQRRAVTVETCQSHPRDLPQSRWPTMPTLDNLPSADFTEPQVRSIKKHARGPCLAWPRHGVLKMRTFGRAAVKRFPLASVSLVLLMLDLTLRDSLREFLDPRSRAT